MSKGDLRTLLGVSEGIELKNLKWREEIKSREEIRNAFGRIFLQLNYIVCHLISLSSDNLDCHQHLHLARVFEWSLLCNEEENFQQFFSLFSRICGLRVNRQKGEGGRYSISIPASLPACLSVSLSSFLAKSRLKAETES